jgi:hypothetical protein
MLPPKVWIVNGLRDLKLGEVKRDASRRGTSPLLRTLDEVQRALTGGKLH